MKKLIQYYDEQKGSLSIIDIAIELSKSIPLHIERFGADNVAVYMSAESKASLQEIGIDSDVIRCNFTPLENHSHSFRWLSIMAMQTESFHICPIDFIAEKRDGEALEVPQLIIAPYIPVLAKYGIPQTGGLCGGDIISVPFAQLSIDAYILARDIIDEHEITDEAEIGQIMGAMLYKIASETGVTIIKYL